jgi:hypothetical protein
MRCNVDSSQISKWADRVSLDVYRKALLQSGLSRTWTEIENAIIQHETSSGVSISEVLVRDLWHVCPSGCSSQRSRQLEQRSDQPDDSLFIVPHPMALGAWPSRPGKTQLVWEPSRTVPSGTNGRHRRQALKALGNAAVPAVVEAIGRAIIMAAKEST